MHDLDGWDNHLLAFAHGNESAFCGTIEPDRRTQLWSPVSREGVFFNQYTLSDRKRSKGSDRLYGDLDAIVRMEVLFAGNVLGNTFPAEHGQGQTNESHVHNRVQISYDQWERGGK